MQAVVERFAEDVYGLCRRAAPDLAELDAPKAMAQLNRRLQEQRRSAARRQELEKQREGLIGRMQTDDRRLQAHRLRLERMCREAQVAGPQELPAAEALSHRFRERQARLAELESGLAAGSGGLPLSEWVEQVLSTDADTLPAAIAERQTALEDLEGRRSALDQEIGKRRQALTAMDGGATAAGIRERQAQVMAEIQETARRFAVLRAAVLILNNRIDRFRRTYQDPLLESAGRIFAGLTDGAFEGLAADVDVRDNPVLLGVRASGERVAVAGMSEGTCDQLFLALRLAGIALRSREAEPMPLILDDILVNFDDTRARRALEILAELSDATQVIFFTHHRHLVEMARNHLPPEVLFVCELDAAPEAG